jgi:hypothetical protein
MRDRASGDASCGLVLVLSRTGKGGVGEDGKLTCPLPAKPGDMALMALARLAPGDALVTPLESGLWSRWYGKLELRFTDPDDGAFIAADARMREVAGDSSVWRPRDGEVLCLTAWVDCKDAELRGTAMGRVESIQSAGFTAEREAD